MLLKVLKFIVIFISVSIISIFTLLSLQPTSSILETAFVSAEDISSSPDPTDSSAIPIRDISKLKTMIETYLSDKDGRYGVVIKNVNTKEEISIREHELFDTASLYKLWVMATTYKQIKNGKIDEKTILSEDVATLNDRFGIDAAYAERTDGTVNLSVKNALYNMITFSDNYAALALTNKISLSEMSKFLNEENLNESKVGSASSNPSSSPHDIAVILEKIYNGTLIDPESSAQMLDLLKQQKLNSKLPKLLPKKVDIAHKTGELDSFSHDVGIVYGEDNEYIIVIMSDTKSQAKANDTIAQISKLVYTFFEDPENLEKI